MKYPKYYKYKNPDPSTAKHASRITIQLLEMIEDKISQNIRKIYHIRPESILGTDLRHSVIRELSNQLVKEVDLINKFEKDCEDMRNYPWSESSYEY